MKSSEKNHTIDVVFVLAVACAFAASILMVLMLGVNIYGSIQSTSNAEFNERVCLSYVSAKVHSNDYDGAVKVGTFEDSSALFLDQDIDGVTYTTIIYVYDGWLRELFSEEGIDLPPEAGTPILEVDSLRFSAVKANLLSVEYSDLRGARGKVFINLRSGGGDIT